jgi:hypothetical protein
MAFIYGNQSIFSKVEARLLSLTAGFDDYLVEIEVVCIPQNPMQGALAIDDLRLVVAFGNKSIGIARPTVISDSFIAFRQLTSAQPPQVRHFELRLSSGALSRLERLRNGSDVVFQLTLLGNITGYAARKPEQKEVHSGIPWAGTVLLNEEPGWVFKPETGRHEHLVVTIARSEWVKLLDAAGYRSLMLIEIEMPRADELGAPMIHMRDAHAAFLEGRYDDTVAQCRTALESVLSDKEFCPWNETRNRDSREKMSIEARFRLS